MSLRASVVACCAGNACAYAIVNTTPLVLGALMQGLGLDEGAAGMLMTAALLTMGITALACAPFLVGERKRRVALGAALVIVLGEVGASLTQTATWMPLWMLAIGLGAGALLAAINAIIATAQAPDRLFGYALMSAYAVAAGLVFGLSPAIDMAGHQGAFATLAAFSLATFPLLRWLPADHAVAHAIEVPQAARRERRAGVLLLLGIVAISAPMMGFYAFIESLGHHLALDAEFIARVFAVQQLASVAGALFAARLGVRLGLTRAIFVATVLHSFAIAVAVLGGGAAAFALGVIGEGFTFLFLLPVLFTLASLFDTSGRWAAAANGALFLATGAAPALVGMLIALRGYDIIAWLMLAATPVGLWTFALSARAARRRQPGQDSSGDSSGDTHGYLEANPRSPPR